MESLKIEHELGERAFEPCQRALEHHETGARQFSRSLEIHQPQRLADLVMLLGRKIEVRLLPMAVTDDIGGFVRAVGHVIQRQVRQGRQRIVQSARNRPLLLLKPCHGALEIGDPSHQRLRFRLVAARLGLADFLRGGIALCLRFLKPGYDATQLGIDFQKCPRLWLESTPFEAFIESFRGVAYGFDIEHDFQKFAGIPDALPTRAPALAASIRPARGCVYRRAEFKRKRKRRGAKGATPGCSSPIPEWNAAQSKVTLTCKPPPAFGLPSDRPNTP